MIELKRGGGDQIFIWVMVVMCAFTTLLFGFAGLALIAEGEGAGAILLIFALPFIWLAYYVYREAEARSSTRVAIDGQTLHLRLPAQRSYVPQEKIETTLPLSSIRTIEARAEGFRAFGATVLQYAYALVLTDDRRIILGADRRFIQPFYQQAAHHISMQTQIPISDRGLIDGSAGFLLVTGQTVPSWDAAPVPREVMEKRFHNEGATWRIVSIITGAALAIGALARVFGG